MTRGILPEKNQVRQGPLAISKELRPVEKDPLEVADILGEN